MSCNGCRVLRKGCSETCVLRPCLQWIDGAEAQGHATVFVAKFFGRAGLMSFISAVPPPHRPALFQSLLYEACGRTINPVGGAAGLLWGGNWDLCQAAVETVLRGGALRPIAELGGATEDGDLYSRRTSTFSSAKKRKPEEQQPLFDLDLCLSPRSAACGEEEKRRRPGTPNSEESVTTSAESRMAAHRAAEERPKLLNLFV